MALLSDAIGFGDQLRCGAVGRQPMQQIAVDMLVIEIVGIDLEPKFHPATLRPGQLQRLRLSRQQAGIGCLDPVAANANHFHLSLDISGSKLPVSYSFGAHRLAAFFAPGAQGFAALVVLGAHGLAILAALGAQGFAACATAGSAVVATSPPSAATELRVASVAVISFQILLSSETNVVDGDVVEGRRGRRFLDAKRMAPGAKFVAEATQVTSGAVSA